MELLHVLGDTPPRKRQQANICRDPSHQWLNATKYATKPRSKLGKRLLSQLALHSSITFLLQLFDLQMSFCYIGATGVTLSLE